MTYVVLDTNAIVGALLNSTGVHALLLLELVGNPDKYTIVVNQQILSEYEDVLSRSFLSLRGLARDARELLSLIEQVSEDVVSKPIGWLVYPDIDDKPFLEAAVYVGGVLITNNLSDFPFYGVRIMQAAEFLAEYGNLA